MPRFPCRPALRPSRGWSVSVGEVVYRISSSVPVSRPAAQRRRYRVPQATVTTARQRAGNAPPSAPAAIDAEFSPVAAAAPPLSVRVSTARSSHPAAAASQGRPAWHHDRPRPTVISPRRRRNRRTGRAPALFAAYRSTGTVVMAAGFCRRTVAFAQRCAPVGVGLALNWSRAGTSGRMPWCCGLEQRLARRGPCVDKNPAGRAGDRAPVLVDPPDSTPSTPSASSPPPLIIDKDIKINADRHDNEAGATTGLAGGLDFIAVLRLPISRTGVIWLKTAERPVTSPEQEVPASPTGARTFGRPRRHRPAPYYHHQRSTRGQSPFGTTLINAELLVSRGRGRSRANTTRPRAGTWPTVQRQASASCSTVPAAAEQGVGRYHQGRTPVPWQ